MPTSSSKDVSDTSPPRFQLLSAEDLRDLGDTEWLIDDILPASAFSVLYGEPGLGKSFLALDWACSIAAGCDWFGHKSKCGNAVYIYAEGVNGLKTRVVAWQWARKTSPSGAWFLPRPINVLDSSDVAGFIDAIRTQANQPRLIVIDTLARCFGDGDENAAKDMNAFVSGVDELRAAFSRTAVLVVHHSGKDPKRGGRGHSALRAAADTVMRLARHHNIGQLTCEKQKDAEQFADIGMRLEQVNLNERRSSCILKPQQFDTVRQPIARLTRSDARALDALRALRQPAIFSDWRRCSGLAGSTFKDTRNRLIERGFVSVTEAGLYRLTAIGPGAELGPEQATPVAT